MIFVDKSNTRAAFDSYTRDYLHTSFNGENNCFIPSLGSDVSFEKFSDKKWKYRNISPAVPYNGWLHILCDEANSLCCYCMRRLTPSEISVEHLIPENFTNLDEDLELQFYYSHSPYLQKYVMEGGKYEELVCDGKISIDSEERMPHLIAHSNLYIACNKTIGCSCNNGRGNRRILPIMAMEDVESWTYYTPEGMFQIKYPYPEVAVTVTNNLDINSTTLIKIRRLWYLFSRKNIYPTQGKNYSTEEKDTILRKTFDIDSDETLIPEDFIEFIVKEDYWTLLLSYDWYYEYYLKFYPT